MNTSLSHLPKEVQEKLSELCKHILNEVPETHYVILFGSYARGNYVEYDQRIEFGLRTCYQSDFDIVVLTPKKKASKNSIERRLRNARTKYACGYADPKIPPVQFLTEYVEDFNEHIIEGQYFYTDIVKEGIVLYNSGAYEIEPVREPNYSQISKLAKKYYNRRYPKGKVFFKTAKFLYNEGDYDECSFMLHQATENYLLTIILTACLYSKKTHDIIEMLKKTKLFTTEAIKIFPNDTEDGNRLLEFLQDAYIQSRYNEDFVVLKEDLDELIKLIGLLDIEAQKFGLNMIAEHEKRANTNI